MVNKSYRDMMRYNIDASIKLAQLASDVTHPGMRGKIREIALKHIFRPLLTDVVDIGSGKIIDHKGNESRETDIIIFSTDINPPILYDEHRSDMGLYPAETCIYAIEVKSKATSTELQKTIENAKHIWSLEYLPGRFDPSGMPIQHKVNLIVPVFFAFDSDLTEGGKSELERYLELDPDGKLKPIIRVICVIGRGYWYFNENVSAWYYWKPTPDHDEVLSFLGGIVNTYHKSILSRGHPSFGNYIMNKEGTKV